MSKLIPTAERISKARALIQKARNIAPPEDRGWSDFGYTAQVKDTLRQAKDMIKFVPMISGVAPELKLEAQQILKEIPQVEKEILHGSQ
jgi:hypothetical protein